LYARLLVNSSKEVSQYGVAIIAYFFQEGRYVIAARMHAIVELYQSYHYALELHLQAFTLPIAFAFFLSWHSSGVLLTLEKLFVELNRISYELIILVEKRVVYFSEKGKIFGYFIGKVSVLVAYL